MPAPLKEELEALAKTNRRSLTAEIVARLERSVGDTDEMGVSDRMRLQGLSFGDEAPEQPRPATKGVSREKLLASLSGNITEQEHVIIGAMLKALREVGGIDIDIDHLDPKNQQPNAGPKPRKRYPKE